MEGQPVWLASLSRRIVAGGSATVIGTEQWSRQEITAGYDRLCRVLAGVGDPTRERLFRMNITLCLHRAATAEEVAALPADWQCALSGMAGGPVEVLWAKGVTPGPSAAPCESPGHLVIYPDRPDLWVPQDCGECPPCRARKIIADLPA
jgi:hypothetical protein